jgi:ferredoxin-2, mitochondrial|tara:strand:+ start:24 stop:497 length:474 start_codon:yes stop_codon:yes gene_type:complete
MLAKFTRTLCRTSHFHRSFTTTLPLLHGHDHTDEHAAKVNIAFKLKDGTITNIVGREGQNLLRLAQQHDIPMEGACEGVCACSTCHVVLADDTYDMVEDLVPLTDEEEDMLDLAWSLTPTSRLGCQIKLTPELEGLCIELPAATRNFYVDGHVPVPH